MWRTFTIIATSTLLASGAFVPLARAADRNVPDVKLRLILIVSPVDPPSVDQQEQGGADADSVDGDAEAGDNEENMGRSAVPDPTPQPPGCIFDNKPLELLV